MQSNAPSSTWYCKSLCAGSFPRGSAESKTTFLQRESSSKLFLDWNDVRRVHDHKAEGERETQEGRQGAVLRSQAQKRRVKEMTEEAPEG